ncbi:hypothetical protein E4U24_008104 [Claviceps purpurea]|nr:hypothetical protein E4U24_008104 [Claviceps purpurea]
MPTKLLTTTWSLGSNRLLNPHHVQKLKKAFVELGGPKRELEQHHLEVLCTGAQVKRMMKELEMQDGKKQAEGMLDFTIWPNVNGREQLELVRDSTAYAHWKNTDSISFEQNMKLRINKRDVAQPDSHGDIWLHIVIRDGSVAEAGEVPGQIVRNKERNSRHLGPRQPKWQPSGPAGDDMGEQDRRREFRPEILIAQGHANRVGDATVLVLNFSIFRQVLDTLADLPGDTASYVKAEGWRKMSSFLGHGRLEVETREFFYPGKGSQEVDQSCRRRPGFLVQLDRESYWQFYQHYHTWGDGSRRRLAEQRPGTDRSRATSYKRDNKKPGMRVDMVAALQHFDKRKVAGGQGQSDHVHRKAWGPVIAEAASIVIQQEVLEFVCGRLEAFKSATAKDQLTQRLHTDNAERYRTRFREAEWAGVLDIIRWYMGPEFRPEWPRLEERQPGDV